uniref:Uncharacterized protein n=1 Tax=Knipowitschia caucasica TaxID=637954 RepID=A0AAV2LF00_KNICA
MCGIWLSLCNSSPLLPLSAMYSSDLSLALSSAPHALWRLAHDPVTEGDLYARTSPVCSSLRAGPAWAFPRQRCVSVWVLSDWRLGDCRSRSTRTRTHTGANMEMRRASWLPAGLALCLAAAILPSISACDRGDYRMLIGDFCLTKFRLDMEALDRSLWCSWPRTME